MKLYRAAALASAGLMAALASVALAATDPGGKYTFDALPGWPAPEQMSKPDAAYSEVVVGTADEECWFSAVPRPDTATFSPLDVTTSWEKPISTQTWTELAATQRMFSGATASVKTASVTKVGVWPVQIADLTAGDRTVVAALHARPGLEVWVFCTAYDGKDHSAAFRGVANSVKTPGDAAWEAAIASAAAAPPAAAAKKK